MKWIPLHIFNSLAKPYLEALDDMIDEEEGELEEDEEEEGQEDQEEQEEGQEEQTMMMKTSTES